MAKNSKDILRKAALDYHAQPKPGKLEIRATKPMANGRDLARAYSPGVAEASIAIDNNPDDATKYTSRANLVVIVPLNSKNISTGNIY